MIIHVSRAAQNRRQISLKKKSSFVDSGFVKTCDELVIDVRDIEAQYTRMSFMESVSFIAVSYNKKSVDFDFK